MQKLKKRINTILANLNDGIHERSEVIAVALLGALTAQNIFLLGPPGTAKSLISRRLVHAFDTAAYFEYLMQRFSTPEEVFGPVSLSELKKDNYVRKTDGFLPTADFSFLDEIWKSSPAILNTLLTIINEKTFRNGAQTIKVPLKVLISAANETPPENQGLEALYDRFLIRLNVPPLTEKTHFEALLQSGPTQAPVKLAKNLVVTHNEWVKWQKEIESISLSAETLAVIHDIRMTLAEKGEELNAYVSDRRWQKAAQLLKAGAYFCDRKATNLVDTLLLRHCLWTTNNNREEVIEIVEEAVRDCGFDTGFSLHAIDKEKEELEKEIDKELYYTRDIYKTVKLNGNKQYFKCTRGYDSYSYGRRQESILFYISATKMKDADTFHPVDEQGNNLNWIKCNFDNQGSCEIEIEVNQRPSYSDWKSVDDFTPKVLFHKGDKKSDVNSRLIDSLQTAIIELTDKIINIIKDIDNKLKTFRTELETPFVPDDTRDIALESITGQLKDMKLRHKDCERLMSLIE
ncbi:MAG: AAA family ATPase [Psychrosphaera sp.]|nr:AAA family ATPase [Psychrosphaera sp.]